MKNFNKKLIKSVIMFILVFGLSGTMVAQAAITLGTTRTFGILSGTFTNTTATTINGDVGYTTPPATMPTINGGTNGGIPFIGGGLGDTQYQQARTDATILLNDLNALPCIPANNLGAIVDLSLVHSATYTPGVYCSTGAMSVGGGGITLNGAGLYVFRSDGALQIVTGSQVILSAGASACDVFWTPTAATTFDANTNFIGTIVDNNNAITVGATTTWTGRALSLLSGIVTTDTDIISVPTGCGLIPPPPVPLPPTLTLVNNFNLPLGPLSYGDFILTATDILNPLNFITGINGAGTITNTTVTAGSYTFSESAQPNYSATPWVCVNNGATVASDPLILADGDNATCAVINTYVAPIVITPVVVSTSGGNSSGGGYVYGCKDPNALNYNAFSISTPALCKYRTASPITPTVSKTAPTNSAIIPTLPKTGFSLEQNTPWYKNIFSKILNIFSQKKI